MEYHSLFNGCCVGPEVLEACGEVIEPDERNPNPVIDGTVLGPDNAQHCGMANVFVDEMKQGET